MDSTVEPAFRALALTVPTLSDVARQIGADVNPDSIQETKLSLLQKLAEAIGADGLHLCTELMAAIPNASELEAVGLRSLKNTLLTILVAGANKAAVSTVTEQFDTALNMTDRLAALGTLLHHQNDEELGNRVSNAFFERFQDNPLVINAWFSIHATTPGERGFETVSKLLKHPQFTLDNPNRARSLLGPYAASNLTAFHREDGAGYALFLEEISHLDEINPQIAARLLTLMGDWRIFGTERCSHAEKHLSILADKDNLSTDTREILERTLN